MRFWDHGDCPSGDIIAFGTTGTVPLVTFLTEFDRMHHKKCLKDVKLIEFERVPHGDCPSGDFFCFWDHRDCPSGDIPLAFHKNGAYNKLVTAENCVKKGEQYEYQRQNF